MELGSCVLVTDGFPVLEIHPLKKFLWGHGKGWMKKKNDEFKLSSSEFQVLLYQMVDEYKLIEDLMNMSYKKSL